jgi:hypothetical protein
VKVLEVVPEGLDILMNDVWCDGADLNEAIVLNEDRITGQVAVSDGRVTSLMEITVKTNVSGELEQEPDHHQTTQRLVCMYVHTK